MIKENEQNQSNSFKVTFGTTFIAPHTSSTPLTDQERVVVKACRELGDYVTAVPSFDLVHNPSGETMHWSLTLEDDANNVVAKALECLRSFFYESSSDRRIAVDVAINIIRYGLASRTTTLKDIRLHSVKHPHLEAADSSQDGSFDITVSFRDIKVGFKDNAYAPVEHSVFNKDGIQIYDALSDADNLQGTGLIYKVSLEGEPWAIIVFQDGDIFSAGVNGITNEALLSVVIHRTKILNEKLPCKENELALDNLRSARAIFHEMSRDLGSLAD